MKKRLLRLRSAILVYLTHRIALPLLRTVRRPSDFRYTELELYQMPEGSLGRDLYFFLEKRNLPLLPHYARHDIKHVLLGYDTTDEGEVCLQSFMLGSGRVSFPVLATVIYGLVTMPEHWPAMRKAWKKGRDSVFFHNWNWTEVVWEPTVTLRNKLFNTAG